MYWSLQAPMWEQWNEEEFDVMFGEEYKRFWKEFGNSKKMVLSTSLNNIVTSRMMSIVAIQGRLFFQTDCTFRKYEQLKGNSNVSLCIDNIQIEGKCEELGHPLDNEEFCNIYKTYFMDSYNNYSALKNERLFMVTPVFIEKWLYIEGVPYIEQYDIENGKYMREKYCGI